MQEQINSKTMSNNSDPVDDEKEIKNLRKNLLSKGHSDSEGTSAKDKSSRDSSPTHDNLFPSKPNIDMSGKPIQLVSNYFPIKKNADERSFFKYAVNISPKIPDDAVKIRRGIINRNRAQIEEKIGKFYFLNTMIYSVKNITQEMSFTSTYDDKPYTLTLKWAGEAKQDSNEVFPIFKKFFFNSLDKVKYMPFKRCFLVRGKSQKIFNSDIEIWTGFNPTIAQTNGSVMVNFNLISRIVRKKRVIDELLEIRQRNNNPQDFHSACKKQLVGTSVLTRYNNDKLSVVEDIDFSQNPQSKFICKGQSITFAEYYQNKYKIILQDKNQPLIVSLDKRSKQKIYLIPELCYLTGLTDQIRSDFKLMKNISQYTIGNAHQKTMDCINMMKDILNSSTYKTQNLNTNFYIEPKPVEFQGRKLDAGCFILGNNQNFEIETTHDIDRKIQTDFFIAPNLGSWGIFYPNFLSNNVNNVCNQLQQVCQTFKARVSRPRLVCVNGRGTDDWIRIIEQENSKMKFGFIICILPGKKSKKGFGYKEIKAHCTSKLGIPTQMILEGTICKDKGLRSVLNKMFIQVCAKANGIPWAINAMPCSSKPTVIISFSPSKDVLSSVCTNNRTFTQYYTKVTKYAPGKLKEGMVAHLKEHVSKFIEKVKFSPQVIIYRENESKSGNMTAFIEEVKEIHEFLKNMNVEFTYILSNKKHNLKIVSYSQGSSNYTNIPSGTLVDNVIIGNEFDFYLVSQKTNQGLAQSTFYKVIYNGLNISPEEMHLLTYKMCFLYYNWVGGIKNPAPQHYAKKLATLMTDVMTQNENGNILLPKEGLNSLYFI